jgi:hypothetical protein
MPFFPRPVPPSARYAIIDDPLAQTIDLIRDAGSVLAGWDFEDHAFVVLGRRIAGGPRLGANLKCENRSHPTQTRCGLRTGAIPNPDYPDRVTPGRRE